MIDLHIHSKFSDGSDTTDEILKKVQQKNISAISLTDHDTTFGVLEIIENAKKYNIKIVPGIEISSVSNGHLIHILGYNIDIKNSQLQDLLSLTAKYFNKTFLERYYWLEKNHYIDFDINKIISYSQFKQAMSLSDILKAMIEDGLPYTLNDWPIFFDKYIKYYKSDFIEKFPIHPSEAVEVINQARGLSTFAHPARIGLEADIKEMELLLPSGLKGIEVYYPYHDSILVNRYEDFAQKHDLIKTGGTDWHGKELTTWNVEIGDYGVNQLPF